MESVKVQILAINSDTEGFFIALAFIGRTTTLAMAYATALGDLAGVTGDTDIGDILRRRLCGFFSGGWPTHLPLTRTETGVPHLAFEMWVYVLLANTL